MPATRGRERTISSRTERPCGAHSAFTLRSRHAFGVVAPGRRCARRVRPVHAGSATAATPSVEVPGAATSIEVSAASGELEDARVVVHGVSGALSVRLAAGAPPLLRQGLSVLRLETTLVAGKAVADPLPPLARRANVRAGEDATLVLRFRVPDATPAGALRGPARLRGGRALVRDRARAPAGVRRAAAGAQRPERAPHALSAEAAGLRRLRGAANACQRRDRQHRDHRSPVLPALRLSHQPGQLGVRDALSRRLPGSRHVLERTRGDADGGRGRAPVQHDAAADRDAAHAGLAHRSVTAASPRPGRPI